MLTGDWETAAASGGLEMSGRGRRGSVEGGGWRPGSRFRSGEGGAGTAGTDHLGELLEGVEEGGALI